MTTIVMIQIRFFSLEQLDEQILKIVATNAAPYNDCSDNFFDLFLHFREDKTIDCKLTNKAQLRNSFSACVIFPVISASKERCKAVNERALSFHRNAIDFYFFGFGFYFYTLQSTLKQCVLAPDVFSDV